MHQEDFNTSEDPAEVEFSPPSPSFHGFGAETVIPGQLVIETAGEGDDEHVVRVYRKRRTGRPRGGGDRTPHPSDVTSSNIVDQSSKFSKSSIPAAPGSSPSSSSASSKSTPKVSSTGTQTRPKIYLLDSFPSLLCFSKLPKTGNVLSVFLSKLKDTENNRQIAAQETTDELKKVWKHHFGDRVIMGFDSDKKEEAAKMIFDDKNIKRKIIDIWKDWHQLEKESKVEGRASKPGFMRKQAKFMNEVLDMPFRILSRGYQDVLKESGIKDWKEDLLHLHNQMERDQVGTCDGRDFKQRKKDNREAVEKWRLDAKKAVAAPESVDDIEEDEDLEIDDGVDKDFILSERKKHTKVDVMGPVAATADRLGLSVRERCMMAASVVNTLGEDINNTNISKSSAWRRTKEERLKLASSVKADFQKPDKLVVHWDGKILKIKGDKESNRVCVYITGIGPADPKKLLGVPETVDGTGMAEFEVVKAELVKWGIKDEVSGMVFDTTSSNTGADIGACKLLEDWLDKPILWLACRHHVHELHLKRVIQGITGQTKDPGMALFRRLKSQWYSLEINYEELCKFDFSTVPGWMQVEGMKVLAWAERELVKRTWPRADYQELLKLTIICLGGQIDGFQLNLPGPDHHARFMSKCLYFLKIKLLLKIFKVTEDEKAQVERICAFILIFYVKAWLQSPLPTSAAKNDLTFIHNMLRYRQVESPVIIHAVMQSCYRHLWYLVPQTVLFALADPNLSDTEKESMARKLHGLDRTKIVSGKPVFPYVDLSAGEMPCLSSFVSSDSWLLFDLLGLSGTQDWLTVPASLWPNFLEFRKLRDFAENVSVCNDIA